MSVLDGATLVYSSTFKGGQVAPTAFLTERWILRDKNGVELAEIYNRELFEFLSKLIAVRAKVGDDK